METLPVELLHGVFDHLDAETIIFSIRPVSRLFLSVTRSYDRYTLNLQLLSQANFHLLRRLIRPQQVISLVLSNDYQGSNQTELFLSYGRLQHFTRLRSLTLLDIDEAQLNFILKRVNASLLTSLSIKIREHDARRAKTTQKLLATAIAQPHLRRLELSIKSGRLSDVPWPAQCALRSLTINTYMSFDNLCNLLQCSPHLHRLVINDGFDSMMQTDPSAFSRLNKFDQLRSLTIEQFRVTIDKLERFLTLVPSLVYLKLIGEPRMLNGERWAQFIQVNLQQLNQFEFYFSDRFEAAKTAVELKFLVSTFQTPFWTERKRWFVISECRIKYATWMELYTVPICKTELQYDPQSDRLSLFTPPIPIDSGLMNTEKNVTSLVVGLDHSFPTYQNERTYHPRFLQVNDIFLELQHKEATLSLQSVLSMIDVTRLVQMTLKSDYFNQFNEEAFNQLSSFFAQAANLTSLTIQKGYREHRISQVIASIYWILPRQLKHLQTPVFGSEQMEVLMGRCEQLSAIKFNVKQKRIDQISEWFDEHTVDSIFWKEYKTITVWLGKTRSEASVETSKRKRIKLIDH